MSTVEQLTQLKVKVDRLKSSRDKAAGVLEKAMETLKENWDCDTVEQAEKLLTKMKKEASDLKEVFETNHAEFLRKWGDKLV